MRLENSRSVAVGIRLHSIRSSVSERLNIKTSQTNQETTKPKLPRKNEDIIFLLAQCLNKVLKVQEVFHELNVRN